MAAYGDQEQFRNGTLSAQRVASLGHCDARVVAILHSDRGRARAAIFGHHDELHEYAKWLGRLESRSLSANRQSAYRLGVQRRRAHRTLAALQRTGEGG